MKLSRLAVAAAGVVLGGAAHAEPGSSVEPKATSPDPLAEAQASEANLQSIAPREGTTVSTAVGASLFVGSGSVGKGGSISLRLGHVATPSVVLTIELAGGAFLHKTSEQGKTLQDGDGNVLVGAQYYTTPTVWIRGGAGVGVYTHNEEGMPANTMIGPAAVVGVGIDLVRKHYWVLGLEAFTIGKVRRDGVLAVSGLCVGLSYY